MKSSTSTLARIAFASASILAPLACSDEFELKGLAPPTGSGEGGKYDPGDGGLPGISSSTGLSGGVGGGSGTSGAGGAPPVLGDFDWRDAVLYFAFVDRFLDGDPANNGQPTPGVLKPADYQGGDWAGVLQKIKDGYFTDLGINALWLTVPMDNTEASGKGTDDSYQYSGYHGYWPKDLEATEERFGKLADLKAVVDAAHAAQIRVIFDYAMNHVHISSPVYAQHPDWFWPIDLNGSSCVCGTTACPWDGDKAKRCWFTSYLPDFDFQLQAARDFSVDNAISWIKNTGADGLRLDAVKHIEDLWITDLRARVTADIESATKQHFYLVGETFSGDRTLLRYYVNPTTMLDGQFDFPLRASLMSAMLIRKNTMVNLDTFLKSNESFYGAGIMSTFLGNHDVPRAIHFADDTPISTDPWYNGKDKSWINQPALPAGTNAFERLANAYTILLTTPGVPLIYYGDEVGMAGAGDPDNRRMMQWSGYAPGQTLLYGKLKKLTSIRAAHSALRRGKRTSLSATADTLAYKMEDGGDVVFVAVNRSDAAQQVSNLPGGPLNDLLGGASVAGPTLDVPARSSMVLVP
jgi:glycosidase